jgi:hypothetical protein
MVPIPPLSIGAPKLGTRAAISRESDSYTIKVLCQSIASLSRSKIGDERKAKCTMLHRSRLLQGKGLQKARSSRREESPSRKDRVSRGSTRRGNPKSTDSPRRSTATTAPPSSLRESLELLNRRSLNSGTTTITTAKSSDPWRVGAARQRQAQQQYVDEEQGYSLEVPVRQRNDNDDDFDCSDSVSSLNDSIYFGGGASVTGGFSSRHAQFHQSQSPAPTTTTRGSPPQRAKSLVVGIVPPHGTTSLDTAAAPPINVLHSILVPKNDDWDDDEEESNNEERDGDIVTLQTGMLPTDLLDTSKNPTRLSSEAQEPMDDQESAAVFTAAQSAIFFQDQLEEQFFPADHGSPTAFAKETSQHDTTTTAVSPISAAASHSDESDGDDHKDMVDRDHRSSSPFGCRDFVQSAPQWLKLVFSLSICALIGAIVLLVVGLNVAWKSQSISESRAVPASSQTTSSPTVLFIPRVVTKPTRPLPPLSPPAPSPVPPLQTMSPTTTKHEVSKGGSSKHAVPTTTPTVDVEMSNDQAVVPKLAPVLAPTKIPTVVSPISALSKSPTVEPHTWIVYLTAGQYSDHLRQEIASSLKTLPTTNNSSDADSTTSFLVHLGDWGDSTSCDEGSFQNVTELFQASSVPVYFVVGDNGTSCQCLSACESIPVSRFNSHQISLV